MYLLEKWPLKCQLLRITFPYIFFIALVALCAGILNTWQKFWVPAFTPVWLNVSFLVVGGRTQPERTQVLD